LQEAPVIPEEHQPTLRVMKILELLAAAPGDLSLTEIASGIGASKSTVQPVVRTLAKRNFITFHEKTYRYSTGIAAYCAGAPYAAGKTLFSFIKTVMEDIARTSGEICQMGVLDNAEVLYVAKVESDQTVRIASHVGKRLPAYCTALGKALLSSKTHEEILRLYPQGFTPHTPRTVKNIEALEKQLQDVRKRGVAYEQGEMVEQTECIAVPLAKEKTLFASLSVSIPAFRSNPKKKTEITALLSEARAKIESYVKANDSGIESFLLE
jgi:DNA-binding IclR family transcriptional regulator